MIWCAQSDGNNDYFNRRWYEYTGMPPGPVNRERWDEIIHPDDRENAWTKWHHTLATGEPFEVEHRMRHHSGEYRWNLVRALPVHNEQGEIERWFGSLTDIHDVKQAQQSLAASEEFTRRLLSSSDDCIKVLDLDGNLLFMNQSGRRAMEIVDLCQIEGLHWPDCWSGPAAEKAWAAVKTAKAGSTGRFQGFCATLAGTPKWWDVAVTAITGPDGKPERLLSISRDITDQKKMEEALRESEHRFRALVEASATIVWRATPNGSIIDGSPEWEKITGQGAETFKSFGWLDAVHSDDREPVISRWQEIIASCQPGTNEFRVLHVNGEYRWFATKAVPRDPTQPRLFPEWSNRPASRVITNGPGSVSQSSR